MGIIASKITKKIGDPPVSILSDINLNILKKDFIALIGKSGSGKSSLLYLLSSLDKPSIGTIKIEGKDVSRMSESEICEFRNKKAGFVFQYHYLISELNALENVLLPIKDRYIKKQKRDYALYLLDKLGIEDKKNRLPRQLSGGESQRVAVARALIWKPKYIFADEPTGSLDTANGRLIMDILLTSNEELNSTVILVTHDREFATYAKRQIHLVDGKISD